MNRLRRVIVSLLLAVATWWLAQNLGIIPRGSGAEWNLSSVLPGVGTCIYDSGTPDARTAPCRVLPPAPSVQSTDPEVRDVLLRASQVENILRGQP